MICIYVWKTHTGAGAAAWAWPHAWARCSQHTFINRFRMLLQLENIFIRIKAKLLACMCVVDADVSVSLIASQRFRCIFVFVFQSFFLVAIHFSFIHFALAARVFVRHHPCVVPFGSTFSFRFFFFSCRLSGRSSRVLPPWYPISLAISTSRKNVQRNNDENSEWDAARAHKKD